MTPNPHPHEAALVAPRALQGPYDRLYASREDNILWGESPTHMLAHLADLPVGIRTIDVGCGDGANSVALERMGFANTGVDISALALNGLRNRARRVDIALRGSYFHADAEQFSETIERQSADVIISCGLYHCLDRHTRLETHKRIMRAVKSGGLILFSTLTDEIDIDDQHGTDVFDLPSKEELINLFAEFEVLSWRDGVIDDRHPPIVAEHKHSVTWVVVRGA